MHEFTNQALIDLYESGKHQEYQDRICYLAGELEEDLKIHGAGSLASCAALFHLLGKIYLEASEEDSFASCAALFHLLGKLYREASEEESPIGTIENASTLLHAKTD